VVKRKSQGPQIEQYRCRGDIASRFKIVDSLLPIWQKGTLLFSSGTQIRFETVQIFATKNRLQVSD